ncbi:hypothetical protein D3C75_1172130 [compost metagenome]
MDSSQHILGPGIAHHHRLVRTDTHPVQRVAEDQGIGLAAAKGAGEEHIFLPDRGELAGRPETCGLFGLDAVGDNAHPVPLGQG